MPSATRRGAPGVDRRGPSDEASAAHHGRSHQQSSCDFLSLMTMAPRHVRNRRQMRTVAAGAHCHSVQPRYVEAAGRFARRDRFICYLRRINWLTEDDVGYATRWALESLCRVDYTDPTCTFECIVLHQRPSRKQRSPRKRVQGQVRQAVTRTAASYPFGGPGLTGGLHSNTLFSGINEFGPIDRCANSGGLDALWDQLREDLDVVAQRCIA